MAALRSRRPGRSSVSKRASSGSMPRLAHIKLSGGVGGGEQVQVSGKSLMIALAGMVLTIGAAIAGAAWLGSSLFDAREAFARTSDAAAASVGFEIGAIEVAGVSGARADEVRALIAAESGQSMLSLDPCGGQSPGGEPRLGGRRSRAPFVAFDAPGRCRASPGLCALARGRRSFGDRF